MTTREEFEQLKNDLGLQQEIDCTHEENVAYRKLLKNNEPLPEGILCRNPNGSPEYAAFYRIEKAALSKDELSEYLQCEQLKSIITIRKCVVFFTVLTVISLVCGVIAALSVL